MNRPELKFALITGLVVTSYITFTLIAFNFGFRAGFVQRWLVSWLIAYLLAMPSLMFVGPFIRKKLSS